MQVSMRNQEQHCRMSLCSIVSKFTLYDARVSYALGL